MSSSRPIRRLAAAACVAALATVPRVAAADLRIHAEGGGLAPIDVLLRDVGPGFYLGGSIDYEVVNLLSVGVFFNFSDFLRQPVECACEVDPGPSCDGCAASRPMLTDPVFDYGVGARMALRLVRHRLAGWFGADSGNLYGEAFLELDLAYHNIGNESRIGWGFGLGYRVLAVGPFGLGPLFRFRHVVAGDLARDAAGEPVHQLYVTFGIEMFLSFDVAGERRTEESPPQGAAGRDGSEDEWEEIDPGSDGG